MERTRKGEVDEPNPNSKSRLKIGSGFYKILKLAPSLASIQQIIFSGFWLAPGRS